MEILVSIHTYNTYGGHSTLTLVGKYLELGAPDFGEALETLDIHVYFSGGKISRHLESLSDQYHSYPVPSFTEKKPSLNSILSVIWVELTWFLVMGHLT